MNVSTQTDLLAEVNAEVDAQEQTVLENIRASAPSISTSAMLVGLTISVWEGNKLDKKASEDITDQNHAKRSSARVHKSLMADCEYLKAIKTHRGIVRNHIHYKYTLPWIHNGPALLTTQAYFEYYPLMQEAETLFWEHVNEFLANYNMAVAQAQVDLGDMFNASEYPQVDDLRRKFKFEVDYIPLSGASDFRLDVGNEALEHLSDSYEKFYAKKFTLAMVDVWERLKEPLENMVEKLDYADGDTKKIFKGTLVDNVLTIVDLMGMVNVTKDPQMQAMERTLRDAFMGVTPEALREDAALRKETRKVALDALRETKNQIDSLPTLEW